MLLTDIANEYSSLFIFNPYTEETVIRIARLFDKRSGIESVTGINLETLVIYKAHLMKLKVAPATFNGYLRYLRILGSYANEQGYITENWFKRLGLMPEPDKLLSSKAINKHDIERVLEWLHNYPDTMKPSWFWIIVLKFS